MQDDNKSVSQDNSQANSSTESVSASSSQSSGVLNNQARQAVQSEKVEPGEQVDARLKSALIEEVKQEPIATNDQIKQPKSKKGIGKMFKFFALFILFLGILIFLFVKFGKKGTYVPSGTKGEIVWWGIQHDASIYQPLIDEFEKENPNMKVVYKKQSTQDYLERLKTALISEEGGPDIFEIHNSWPVMLKDSLSTLPSSVMSVDEYKNSFYPIIVSNLILEKGVVGMPLEYDALTLYINDDVFTSALKAPPIWWDEIPELAQELTQRPDGQIVQGGAALGITENVDHWPEIIGLMLIQDGVNPAKPTGDVAVKVFSFYHQFAGLKVWDNTMPDSTTAFARGELAMYFGPTRRASEIVEMNPNLKFRTTKLPQLRTNNPGDPSYSYATYWVQSVSERSGVKEAAWMFLKYLSREDSLKKINENIAKSEAFKRVYPRPNMNSELAQDTVLGSVVYYAYDARSFYLADETYDGEKGINTLVDNVYEEAVGKKVSEKSLLEIAQELSTVLSKFGVKVK